MDVTRFFGVDDINKAPGFMAVNPQKLSAQINMKTGRGIDLLLDLIRKSDILIENLRPGAMQRLGLGYERVKAARPDIIYTAMGMYGEDGPLSYQTGYAPCFAALGGVSALVGYEGQPPAGLNVRYADSTFGAAAAFASLAALNHRQRTGEGQFIDLSAVETMTSMIGDSIMDYTLNGEIRCCDGNRHPEMAPHGVYPARDGEWLALAVLDNESWSALAAAIGQPDLANDPRFATLADRKIHEEELDALIGAWSHEQDAAAAAKVLQTVGVAATKSQSSVDLVADELLWTRGLYREVTETDGSTRTILGPGWNMSDDARIDRAAPRLGEHNAYVFGDLLGLSAEEQHKLGEAGVTR
jgi:crotonobetainyl-CoA:carnitine CoA-transferase CaiB-like acyl-CoA transferase